MKYATAFFVGLVSVGLVGCGGGEPKLVRVTGTITLNGKPYGGALVEFMPDASNREGTLGADTTGPEGNYMAHTAAGRAGLTPGKYQVRVSKAPASVATAGDEPPTPKNDAGQLLAESTAAPKAKKKADPTEGASGAFPAEGPSGGGVLDFDVKAKAAN